MAKTYIVQRTNSKGTKFLATDPKAKKVEWAEDPSDAWTFDDLESAEAAADLDAIGGDAVRSKTAINAYDEANEAKEAAPVRKTRARTPALEDLAPIAKAKPARKVTVIKPAAKKSAPKTVVPVKKAKVVESAERSGRRGGIEETKLTAMRLTPALIEQFKDYGGGNVTAGVKAVGEKFFARARK